MKKRKTMTSGEVTSTHQKWLPVIGPRCQRAIISCPDAASTPIPTAKDAQKTRAMRSRCRRERITNPPVRMIARASAIHHDMGPHQKSSGSARVRPRARKQTTRPKLDGLNTWLPRHLITYFESSETAAVPAKIHQPRRLHQSPCSVPGTRRMKATPLPVRSALAGHARMCCLRATTATSMTKHVASEMRICAIETRKSNATWPWICREKMTPARWRRGSLGFGSCTGYMTPLMLENGDVNLDSALRIVNHVVAAADS